MNNGELKFSDLVTFSTYSDSIFYTNTERLNELRRDGKVLFEWLGTKESDSGFVYGNYFKYSLLDGTTIYEGYKDNQNFGWSSQPCQIEITELNKLFV